MASELFIARKQNDLGRVRELLGRGADPNLQDNYGWTALFHSSWNDNIDMVRLLLLDHRTDPNLRDSGGETALMFASRLGHTDVVKLLEAACWNRNIAQPLTDLGIFPEGLIREHLTV